MKIRSNYVSNSSSSSFIIEEDLSSEGINCLKLSQEQKELINGYNSFGDIIKLDIEKDYYLTQFISDCANIYDKVIDIPHIFYQEGQLSEEPRMEDFYNEYQIGEFSESVYILKEHDVPKQMSLNKFYREHKKTELAQDFIVKYESDGIKLIYIWK
jgi:hypothetical protein